MAKRRQKRQEQEHVDTTGQERAEADYKEKAADHAKKSQRWKEAQQTLEVRQSDLVKVHAHTPFDPDAAGRIAKETARAIANEKVTLEAKQEAKKALDESWVAWRSYDPSSPTEPLIPDDEDPETTDDDTKPDPE